MCTQDELRRCYTVREVQTFFGLLALLTILTLILWDAAGWVLALWIFSPFWFAMFMGPLIRPRPLHATMMMVTIFIIFMLWFRAYLTECRIRWKDRFIADNFDDNVTYVRLNSTSGTVRVPNNPKKKKQLMAAFTNQEIEEETPSNSLGALGDVEAPTSMLHQFLTSQDGEVAEEPIDNRELKAYCDSRNPNGNLPQFYPLGEPRGVNSHLKHAFRATCPIWTCTFTQQGTKNKWILVLLLTMAIMLNVWHASCACPTQYCNSAEYLNDTFGCGRFRFWWIWVWVWLIPMWVISYITFIKGFGFGDLYNMIPNIFNTLLADTQRSLTIIVIVLLMLIAYFLRDRIYQFLGIDDRNVVHQHLDRSSSRGLQVCVWIVCGSQRDFPSSQWADVKDMTVFEHEQGQRFGCCGGRRYEVSDPNPIAGAGKTANMFVRLAYGDNEPQNSRIVRRTEIIRPDTVVPFKETFSMDIEDNRESETTLHVQVRHQAIIGAQELGRVVLTYNDIKEAIHDAEKRVDELYDAEHPEGYVVISTNEHNAVKRGDQQALHKIVEARRQHREMDEESAPLLHCCQDMACRGTKGRRRRKSGVDAETKLQPLEAAEEQVLWMMHENPHSRKATGQLEKVGFKPYRLSRGGAIWLAFAWLPED